MEKKMEQEMKTGIIWWYLGFRDTQKENIGESIENEKETPIQGLSVIAFGHISGLYRGLYRHNGQESGNY